MSLSRLQETFLILRSLKCLFFCILRYQYLTKVVLNFKEALYFWALGLVLSLIYNCNMFEKECGFVMQMSKQTFISGLFYFKTLEGAI